MLKVQKLKQPKTTSGVMLKPKKSVTMAGITVKNGNDFEVHVAEYVRKEAVATSKESRKERAKKRRTKVTKSLAKKKTRKKKTAAKK